VKKQSSAFFEKSRSSLAKAQDLLDVLHWPEDAGRAAYLAGLHAAQALIFEHTDRIAKSHRGVQRKLARLTKDDPRFDLELRAFLGRTYDLKAIADYQNRYRASHLQSPIVVNPFCDRMKPSDVLDSYRRELRQLVCRHGLPRVRIFGSVLTGTDAEQSDVALQELRPVVYAHLHALDFTLDEATPLIGRLAEIDRRIAAAGSHS
jgi:uncharacterized protein (UPF0332 family)